MARWKLMVNHYLNIEGTKWEYVETDRVTGRPKRTQFPVPRFLDILDPGDWTNKLSPDSGEIIVTNGGACAATDIRFIGEPTPDMQPVDDEAKKISASFEDQWRRGADAMISGKSYADEVVDKLHTQMGDLQKAFSEPPKVEIAGLDTALAAIAAVMQQNQQLLAELAKSNRRL